MTTQTEKSSSFLESFGRFLGQLPMGVQSPILEKRAELEFQKQKRLYEENRANQLGAIERAGELIRQRDLVEDYQQEPLLEGMHGVRPEWGETDAMKLFHAYGEAGIDPEKRAKSEQAELATEAFQRGINGITNQAALVNIGMGKEYKPVELEGGVFYNPYDTQNFQLGSTDKHQAETRLKKTEADEQELRLQRIRGLGNDLMQLNAMNSKELGKPIEAVVEKDGKSVKTLISQDSSGNYRHRVVTDDAGLPLEIPPEDIAGGASESPLMRDARVLYENGVAPDMKTALEMSAYSKTKSPGERFNFLWQTHEKPNSAMGGLKPDQWQVARSVFDSWSRGSYGQPIPVDFAKVINSIDDFPENEKTKLLDDVKQYNQQIALLNPELMGISNQPGVISPATSAPVVPTMPAPITPASIEPPMPTMPAAPAPTMPAQPQMELQPLTPQAISTAWQAINSGEDPAKVRAGLTASGFDTSAQSIERLTIDAVNAGVPQDLFQKYLASIGLAASG